MPSLRLSSRSVLYWLQAFSCRHFRVSTSAGVLDVSCAGWALLHHVNPELSAGYEICPAIRSHPAARFAR